MNLQESGQMYLETLLILTKKMPSVRAIDVCEYMNYSKPSVSRAMGLLKEGGYIKIDANGYITLTQDGKEYAKKVYERHNVLHELLKIIGVSEETALNDACKIEHVISEETFSCLKEYVKDKTKNGSV